MNVGGLDLSTARIGYAAPSGELCSIRGHAKADEPYRRLHELRRELERTITMHPPRPELMVIEDYSLGSPGRLTLITLGELGGMVRTRLFELDIPMAFVRPSTVKRFATGNGNATKEQMIAAANWHIGAELASIPVANDDEADAYHLRRMGLAAGGLIQPLAAHELDALSIVKWPAQWMTAPAPNPTPSSAR